MKKPIPLSLLIEALELDCDEFVTRVDTEGAVVVSVSAELFHAVEAGDDEALEDVSDWERDSIAIARAIVEDTAGRFVDAPDKFEFHEYRQMERFIRTVEDDDAADQLWRAIKGKGAFRYFKDTAARLDLLDAWYRFRDEARKQFVIDWAEANDVAYTDDTRREGNA